MPLTQIDEVAALVSIDLQKGLSGFPLAHPFGDVVARTAEMAREFRKRGLPVVLVNVTGMAPGRTDVSRPKFSFPPDWAELMPELEPQAGDHLVSKQRVGAFLGTNLDEILRSRGVTQIFLTGVATGSGVESTARSAYDLGYNVVFVADAMTDRDAETHRFCTEKVFPKLGELCGSADVLKAIQTKR
jgi:nicotinamidase-related amidase